MEGAELPDSIPGEADPVGFDSSRFARELAQAFGIDPAEQDRQEDSEEGSSFFSPRHSGSSSDAGSDAAHGESWHAAALGLVVARRSCDCHPIG